MAGKIIDMITITELDNGTFDVYCKALDVTDNAATYPEALEFAAEFVDSMKDEYRGFLTEELAFKGGWQDRPDL